MKLNQTIPLLSLALILGGCASKPIDPSRYIVQGVDLLEFDCHPDIPECQMGPHDAVIPGIERTYNYRVRPAGPFERDGLIIERY